MEYGFSGSYSTNFTKNKVGCPMEGTFGIMQGAFEVFILLTPLFHVTL